MNRSKTCIVRPIIGIGLLLAAKLNIRAYSLVELTNKRMNLEDRSRV